MNNFTKEVPIRIAFFKHLTLQGEREIELK